MNKTQLRGEFNSLSDALFFLREQEKINRQIKVKREANSTSIHKQKNSTADAKVLHNSGAEIQQLIEEKADKTCI